MPKEVHTVRNKETPFRYLSPEFVVEAAPIPRILLQVSARLKF
jgi:hypothetical protein